MKNPEMTLNLGLQEVEGAIFNRANRFIKPKNYGSTTPITIGEKDPIYAAYISGKVKNVKTCLNVPKGVWAAMSYLPELNLTLIGLIKL